MPGWPEYDTSVVMKCKTGRGYLIIIIIGIRVLVIEGKLWHQWVDGNVWTAQGIYVVADSLVWV